MPIKALLRCFISSIHTPPVLMAAALPALVCALLAQGPARAEVTIASIAPLSTYRPDTALGVLRGTELMLEAVNAAGGLLGQKLRSAQIDDGCDPGQAEIAAKLAIASRPVLVIGGACSTAAIHVAQSLAAAGILQITPNAATLTMTKAGIATLFRMTSPPDHEGVYAAALIATRWAGRRIAVADDGNVNWHEAASAVAIDLKQRGMAPILNTQFQPNQSSYGSFVQELKASHVELLYLAGRPSDMGLIVHEIAAAGLTIQIVCGRNAKVDVFRQTAGQAAEDVLFTERRDWTDLALADPVLAAEKARGGDINVFVVSAYAAVKIWSQAVALANSFDAAAVAAAMKSRRFSTPLGDIAFDDKGGLTLESEAWSWYRWHGGRAEPVH